MKIDQQPKSNTAGFLQTVSVAVAHLKQQLQRDYEQSYPGLREIIHLVIKEEESRAWQMSAFPHLLLPDLVEAHVAKLNLQAVETDSKHADLFAKRRFGRAKTYQLFLVPCG